MLLLALSGSLRLASYNGALLTAAQALVPEGVTLDIFGQLREIPPYGEDARIGGDPASITALREAFRRADAVIFATPEYNRSFSGVLKNALDWLSRPPEPPLAGKAALVIGAGPGALGTGLANYHLRQVLSVMGIHVVPGREILVGGAAVKFDGDMRLIDPATVEALRGGLADLVSLARRLG